MGVGPSTIVVNGQRIDVPTGNAYNPVGFGQLVQMQPIRNLNQPPMVGIGGGNSGNGVMGTDVVGGYGTAGNNAAATISAAQNPWGLRESPTMWTIGFLLLGLIMLSAIHWRKTTLAGAGANAHVGPAEARAEGSV